MTRKRQRRVTPSGRKMVGGRGIDASDPMRILDATTLDRINAACRAVGATRVAARRRPVMP